MDALWGNFIFIIWLGAFLSPGLSQAQSKLELRGRVFDEHKKPLEFATIVLPELNIGTHTDNKGAFTLNFFSSDSVFKVEFRYVNKATDYQTLMLADLNKKVEVYLKQQSLTLKDVQVQAVRERLHSNTSIIIDREAIEQSQAFSLADILQMLPGKKTTAPNLQSPQTLTLRTDANGQNALNNSFGIAIYIDGVRITNDANMQARSESIRGISGASITNQKYGGFDVTYNGFDLRDIPVERIERIEIIQGVADAKYGEMTNGAILITTRAGGTPLEVSLRTNEGSTQITASKGITLDGKAGALNLGGGYTYSNADPTDKIKSYKRVNASLQWSVNLAKQLSNTFGVGYDMRLDNVKMDPDDDAEKRTFQRGHTINLSNRLTWQPVNGFLQQIVLGAAYSTGKQETYNQWLLNGPPKAVADKDTTGIYEGYYIPGAYLAVEQILGNPISFNGSLELSARNFNTGHLSHRLSGGASIATSGNTGQGIIIDPERPRWGIFNNQTERPVDYSKLVPFATNVGFYIQDNLSGKLLTRKYNLNFGFRTDVQNGFASYQPRLSGHYQLTQGWGISLAYGVSTKAPSLAHRYPAPSWLDIPLLNLYNGNADQSLFLVYTRKVPTDNADLKPAKSQSLEFSLDYKGNFGGGSVTLYAKKNKDGFSSTKEYIPIILPVYDYTVRADHTYDYYPTDKSTFYAGVGRNVIGNGLYSGDYGIEFIYSTKEFKKLATRLSISSAINYSEFDSRFVRDIEPVSEQAIRDGSEAVFAVYNYKTSKNATWNSTVSSITHIPQLGFTVNLSMDISLLQTRETPAGDNRAIGYYTREMTFIEIDPSRRADPAYDYLKRDLEVNLKDKLPFIYTALNVSIAKEIKKNIRLMVRGYNLFNIRPRYRKPGTNTYTVFNNPASITAGISIKL